MCRCSVWRGRSGTGITTRFARWRRKQCPSYKTAETAELLVPTRGPEAAVPFGVSATSRGRQSHPKRIPFQWARGAGRAGGHNRGESDGRTGGGRREYRVVLVAFAALSARASHCACNVESPLYAAVMNGCPNSWSHNCPRQSARK